MTLGSSFQKIEPNKSPQLQAEGGTANQRVKYVRKRKRKSKSANKKNINPNKAILSSSTNEVSTQKVEFVRKMQAANQVVS